MFNTRWQDLPNGKVVPPHVTWPVVTITENERFSFMLCALFISVFNVHIWIVLGSGIFRKQCYILLLGSGTFKE